MFGSEKFQFCRHRDRLLIADREADKADKTRGGLGKIRGLGRREKGGVLHLTNCRIKVEKINIDRWATFSDFGAYILYINLP
jgi:hypothetical protein